MSHEEREAAACFYEFIAAEVSGLQSGLARLYNIERARFPSCEIFRIASDAVEFGVEIGYNLKQR